ncbi:hypothetical protein GGR51DRAFT_507737 [Nemania sp. FL0031]|nr:hypothetical protein GGR51DRAFT_507737 [Nemania sp. FL0031]
MDASNRIAELEEALRDANRTIERLERDKLIAEERVETEKIRAEERIKTEKILADDRIEAEKTRAEDRFKRAKIRVEKAELRAERAVELIQRTTLSEYIEACHELMFSQFKVETNPKLTTTGLMTNPQNKLCPTNLRPWPDFLQEQRTAFGRLEDAFSSETELFWSRAYLAVQGEKTSERIINSEKALESFLHYAVEDPVMDIMKALKKVDSFMNPYDIGNGIVFENHPSAISFDADEVVSRQAASPPPRTPGHGVDLNQLRPDQICVYRSERSTRTMLYVSEYKAPHKLNPPHLRKGLRPMNMYKEVVNRKTIPTRADPEGQFQYHAERLTAAALTQIYHYMIMGGLEFGLLTTGEAIVFLKIDWKEPEILYYHLAEPEFEVNAHPDNFRYCTAVGQYLAFTLIALGLRGQRQVHGQDEVEQVKMNLKRWAGDFESTLRSIPANERQPPDSFSGYAPTTYSTFDRSPIVVRNRNGRPQTDEPAMIEPRRDPSESSDDGSSQNLPDTLSPAPTVRRSQRILVQRPPGGHGQGRQYCTQKCLLGLVNGGLLDPLCPNVTSHRRDGETFADYAHHPHPVRHDEWLRQLSQQLAKSLDQGVVKLGIQGARGVLFQVTMLAYEYTFICKGTVPTFIPNLKHEAAVYERLKPVQGISVPVFLGAIDLRSVNRTYYYDHRVYIIYMTFLSWGGYSLYTMQIEQDEKEKLEASLSRALQAIHQEGVVHEDVRMPNILHNPETGGIMLIDFERSTLLDGPRRPFGKIVPNKRPRNPEVVNRKNREDRANKTWLDRRFATDRAMAKGIFCE